MFNNLTNFMFLLTLMLGSIISISSNSWLGAWMGLEINLLAFIPLLTNFKNLTSTESFTEMFIVQALASATLLFTILLLSFSSNSMLFEFNTYLNIILNSSLLMKMGAAPFHSWFPEVMEGLTWITGFILMTWQKIAPMMILSYCMSHMFIMFSIILSIFVGSIGGFNQTNLRSLMAYSSINHLGWMLSSILISLSHWLVYYIFYTIISLSIISMFYQFNIFYFNQVFSSMNQSPVIKFLMFCNLLSLGGLPPFTGFLPKWIIIQSLSSMNMFLMTTMVMLTLITLFFYIRLTYSAFMIQSTQIMWNKMFHCNLTKMSILLNFFSSFGLILICFIYMIL
uniref:NADH-ubiquinone oxidoreductase chain 2 n=1 Tax=Ascalohybris subjacens TaxID=1310335 RepID=M9XHH6_ASCSB|nr:NADH dehydrogenase subunit 2 [Ascalohybris subjacens]AGK07584.1 NADH dehydrogenase subunit 2 [Ascalohybris subjacens]